MVVAKLSASTKSELGWVHKVACPVPNPGLKEAPSSKRSTIMQLDAVVKTVTSPSLLEP